MAQCGHLRLLLTHFMWRPHTWIPDSTLRFARYVASAWLLLIAVNLTIGGYFDVAVRDAVMSIAAFVVARAAEVRNTTRLGAATGARTVAA